MDLDHTSEAPTKPSTVIIAFVKRSGTREGSLELSPKLGQSPAIARSDVNSK